MPPRTEDGKTTLVGPRNLDQSLNRELALTPALPIQRIRAERPIWSRSFWPLTTLADVVMLLPERERRSSNG